MLELGGGFRYDPGCRVVGNKAFCEWIVRGIAAAGERLDHIDRDLGKIASSELVKKDTYWKPVE